MASTNDFDFAIFMKKLLNDSGDIYIIGDFVRFIANYYIAGKDLCDCEFDKKGEDEFFKVVKKIEIYGTPETLNSKKCIELLDMVPQSISWEIISLDCMRGGTLAWSTKMFCICRSNPIYSGTPRFTFYGIGEVKDLLNLFGAN